ncbi:hypothetical protein TcasGA2_TC009898 [Tribolium castaneum]|uniref:Uncharacterized protein n=1 Tax=Tribolium castaneum TaxID=7070 RepID=D6WQ95_TRICA|nr:hypothetical protein TcasGA2_TC009898 [Tribolium castaneum]
MVLLEEEIRDMRVCERELGPNGSQISLKHQRRVWSQVITYALLFYIPTNAHACRHSSATSTVCHRHPRGIRMNGDKTHNPPKNAKNLITWPK